MKSMIISAIKAGLFLGASDEDWDAPEMDLARRLTHDADFSWDFVSWTDALSCVEQGELGGIFLADIEEKL